MKPVTVVLPYSPEAFFTGILSLLTNSGFVERVVIISQKPVHLEANICHVLVGGPTSSHETLNPLLSDIQTKFLLFLTGTLEIAIQPKTLEKFLAAAETTKAGTVYSDFYDESEQKRILHPLNDYQPGSVRDDFNFGSMILYSTAAVRKALEKYGPIPSLKYAGLYDLRLKVSSDHPIDHLPEPLYSVVQTKEHPGSENLFAYVDPRNEPVQKEMEVVFTDYLKRIGAYLPSSCIRKVNQPPEPFPVGASVVIPVKNRNKTVAEAVKSALSQETDFPFNVIVVDNHSTDGTTSILSDLTGMDSNLRHIIPKRMDLGIGGCWNEALQSKACGRYAVQLDSDDLYSGNDSLQKMVDKLRQGRYGMVVGSYTLVDSKLKEIPPGLISHREWTDENGHNNALRINGLGAPRAFNTGLMRKIGFLNVSYGEITRPRCESPGNIASEGFTKVSTSAGAGRTTPTQPSASKRPIETMPSRTRSGPLKFSPGRRWKRT